MQAKNTHKIPNNSFPFSYTFRSSTIFIRMHYTISTQFLVCLKLLFLFTGKLLLRNDKIEKYRESIGDPGDQSKSVQFFAFINLVLSFRLNQFKMVVCVCV